MPIPLISVTGITGDLSNTFIDRLLPIVEDLYESSGAQALLNCPNSAHTRGWKIDWIPDPSKTIYAGGIELGLRIPKISWAPCGCYESLEWPVLSVGFGGAAVVSRALRKKSLKKISLYLKDKFSSPYQSLKHNWYRYRNWGLRDWDKFVKLPPVPPGHKRLYRMNRKGDIPIASDSDGWGTGRWFSDSPDYVERHAKYAGHYDNGGTFVTYVDVPNDIASNCHMGNPDSKWRKRLDESGEKMDGGRFEGGTPPSQTNTNPARFVGNLDTAKYEYFLDSEYANQANKISKFSSLPDINVLHDAWKSMERLFDQFDSEQFLDNPLYRNNFLNEWNQTTNNFKDTVSAHFDNSDFVFDWLMKGNEYQTPVEPDGRGGLYRPSPAGLENLFSEDSEIMKTVIKATALFTFITQIMSVTDVVREQNCSPIGRDSAYGLTPKDKVFIANLRNSKIAANEPVWAELNNETCECSDCPSGWNLCDNSSITNLYSSYGNLCHPPCCGDQELKPITLVETCKCACPDGKVFMPCDCSECKEGSGTPVMDSLIGSDAKKGLCVDPNPDPSKLEWNSTSCTYECKTTTRISPPHLWGGSITVPIEPPCKPGKTRQPPNCECSGSYSVEPCNLFDYNIVSSYQIKLVK